MDSYTKEQRDWLEARFRAHDPQGVYLAHQPVYGFRSVPSEPGHTLRYIIAFRILQALGAIAFDSLLDAGGGEGYKAHLVRKFWSARAVVSDLSVEACRRATELFSLPSVAADLHELPFDDGTFDVVICSESLEHVTDYRRGVEELLRVARRALIITVPHEPVDHDRRAEHHAHIHAFTLGSLSYLEERGMKVRSLRMLSPLLTIPASLAEAAPRQHNPKWRHPRILTEIYNRLVPIAHRLFDSSAAAAIVKMDCFFSRILPFHNGILYLIIKEPAPLPPVRRQISPAEMIATTVPFLRIAPMEKRS